MDALKAKALNELAACARDMATGQHSEAAFHRHGLWLRLLRHLDQGAPMEREMLVCLWHDVRFGRDGEAEQLLKEMLE